MGLKLSSCKIICIIDDFELTRINVENCTDEYVFKLDGRVLSFFKEHFSAFEIKHFDGFVFDVVSQVVGSYEGCGRVIPLDCKDVSIIVVTGHWLSEREIQKLKLYYYKRNIISINKLY